MAKKEQMRVEELLPLVLQYKPAPAPQPAPAPSEDEEESGSAWVF